MEIIEIPGYTDFEKARIASDFIIPKQVIENGLSRAKITFQKGAILEIINRYTMESGVRNLEREIAAVIRKIARKAVKEGFTGDLSPGGETPFCAQITTKGIYKYLGNPKFQEDLVYKESCPGLVHGLAWTELGGTLLPVEITILEGNGELILTGSLGDVMKESARIALSFILSKHSLFGLKADFQKTIDIHIHVPEGAIPKDGPSAGITMTSAMISALTEIPIRSRCAMTGEVTLTGRILPIGGVKEKILAAHRNKMDLVLMPEGNRKDLVDLPKEARDSIKFVFVDTVLEAMGTLFPDLEMKTAKTGKKTKVLY
jgi:ATP-dependent Lon protease